MNIAAFITENKWALLFYAIILLLVYLNRNKFDKKGIVSLYRTKLGLASMDRLSEKYRELVKILGYIGIGVAYIGLFVISIYLVHNLYSLITLPKTTAGISLVVPGINIPGSPFKIPLFEGWIALMIIIIVHEFSHGVVARAHNLKIQSSGMVFIGPILGAFVEPDEKQVAKAADTTQYSVFAAGPFSNILLALLVLLVVSYAVVPAIDAASDPIGFSVLEVTTGFPAEKSGLKAGEIITSVDGVSINNSADFAAFMNTVPSNKTLTLIAAKREVSITTTTHPEGKTTGYIGVRGFKDEFSAKKGFVGAFYPFLRWTFKVFELIYMLSLGIGLVNLLPLGPTDGGRMLHLSLQRMIPDKKKSAKIFLNVTIFFLSVLALNLFWPLIGKLF